MNLKEQKESIQNTADKFNARNRSFNGFKIRIFHYIFEGDKWDVIRTDGEPIATFLTYKECMTVLNALINFRKAEKKLLTA